MSLRNAKCKGTFIMHVIGYGFLCLYYVFVQTVNLEIKFFAIQSNIYIS